MGAGAILNDRLKVVLLVGLPGSGKSTWRDEERLPALSSDAIRAWLADDENDQTIHARVFQTLRYLLRQRLAIGRPVTCVDATSLTPAERRPYIEIARAFGCEVEAVFFDVPLEVCRERNAGRSRVVPDDVLDKMAAKLVPPGPDEGFARITVVR